MEMPVRSIMTEDSADFIMHSVQNRQVYIKCC